MFIFILSNETFHENSQNVCASVQSKTWGPHYRVISSFNMAPFTAYSGKYMLNTFLFDTDAFNGIHSIYKKKKRKKIHLLHVYTAGVSNFGKWTDFVVHARITRVDVKPKKNMNIFPRVRNMSLTLTYSKFTLLSNHPSITCHISNTRQDILIAHDVYVILLSLQLFYNGLSFLYLSFQYFVISAILQLN